MCIAVIEEPKVNTCLTMLTTTLCNHPYSLLAEMWVILRPSRGGLGWGWVKVKQVAGPMKKPIPIPTFPLKGKE
jgi:hypothetical protein